MRVNAYAPRATAIFLCAFFALCAAFAAGCKPPKPEAAQTEAHAQANEPPVAIAGSLPIIENGAVYAEGRDFSFPIPNNWRVVPVPTAVADQVKKQGKEEILLRPVASLDGPPYIRVSRIIGLQYNVATFKGDVKGAASAVLDQFVGGKHDRTIIEAELVGGESNVLRIKYKADPYPDETVEALVFFAANYTLAFRHCLQKGNAKFSPKPMMDVVNGIKQTR